MENKVKGKSWLDLLRSNIIQGDRKDSSIGEGAVRGCAGAKAAWQMTVELCKKVTLLKSRDINLCHAIAQVLSQPLGALYHNVLLGFTAQRFNVCGEASNTHTSSG